MTLAVYGPEPLWVFKAVVLTGIGRLRLDPPVEPPIVFDVTKPDQAYLPMFTKSDWWPRRYSITFDKGYDAWYRQGSGQVIYPPLLTRVPLLMTRGASDATAITGGIALSCGADCTFAVLHNTQRGSHVQVEVEPRVPSADSCNRFLDVQGFANTSNELSVSLDATAGLIALNSPPCRSAASGSVTTLDVPAESRWYKIRVALKPSASNEPTSAMKVVLKEQ